MADDDKIVLPPGATWDADDAPPPVNADSGAPAGAITPPAGATIIQQPTTGGGLFHHDIGTPDTPTTPTPRGAQDWFFNQLPRSAGDFITNTLGAMRHPINSLEGIAKVASGGVQAAARAAGIHVDQNEYDDVAKAFADYATSRWGSLDNIKEKFYTDPVGMMSDFSILLGGAGGVADVANLSKIAKVLGTAGEVANPMFLPGRIVGGVAGHFMPAKAAEAAAAGPAFDPRSATFEGELPGEYDLESRTFTPGGRAKVGFAPKPEPPPPGPDMAALTQDAVKQKAYDLAGQEMGQGAVPGRDHWLKAEEYYRNNPLKPPETPQAEAPPKAAPPPKGPTPRAYQTTPEPPPTTPTPAPAAGLSQNIRGILGKLGITAGGIGAGFLADHIAGAVAGGGLAVGAIKLIPVLLKSPAGQQLLSRIGPGTTPAAAMAAVREMVPLLNAMYRSQQQGSQDQLGLQVAPPESPMFLRAKGGMVNPELARIQRERLRLPGILHMLEQSK